MPRDAAPGAPVAAADRRAPYRWEHWAAAGLLAVMALIAFANILSRHLFHYSLSFTEEITINLFVWMTVIGSGLAFERGSQLGMVSVYRMLSPRWQRRIRLASAVSGGLLFLAVDILLIRTIYFELTVFHAVSPALNLPVWCYYAPVPVCSLAVFRGLHRGIAVKSGTAERQG